MHKLARAVSSCTGGNCSIPSVDWGASAWGANLRYSVVVRLPGQQATYLPC